MVIVFQIIYEYGFKAIGLIQIPSGTVMYSSDDRLGFQKVINIQADEPMVLQDMCLLWQVNVQKCDVNSGNPFGWKDPKDPNHVKVVVDENRSALLLAFSVHFHEMR